MMKTRLPVFLLIVAAFTLSAFKAAPVNIKEKQKAANVFQLSSADFRDNGIMPVELARKGVCGGKNISPSLQWINIPPGTKSFALLCIDLHPVASRWMHWMVINIPAGGNSIPSGASRRHMPRNSRELLNSFGEIGWGGPQPPKGTGFHQYVFTLYALDVEKIAADIEDEEQFQAAIRGKVLGKATLTGLFQQQD
jgi:Raf kinase inhibitor-like YbhB/YbcL family protein